jgi:hypothetical protein
LLSTGPTLPFTSCKGYELVFYESYNYDEDESNSGLQYGNRVLPNNEPTRKMIKNKSISTVANIWWK